MDRNKFKVEFTIVDNDEYGEDDNIYSTENLISDLKSTLGEMNFEIEGDISVKKIS